MQGAMLIWPKHTSPHTENRETRKNDLIVYLIDFLAVLALYVYYLGRVIDVVAVLGEDFVARIVLLNGN